MMKAALLFVIAIVCSTTVFSDSITISGREYKDVLIIEGPEQYIFETLSDDGDSVVRIEVQKTEVDLNRLSISSPAERERIAERWNRISSALRREMQEKEAEAEKKRIEAERLEEERQYQFYEANPEQKWLAEWCDRAIPEDESEIVDNISAMSERRNKVVEQLFVEPENPVLFQTDIRTFLDKPVAIMGTLEMSSYYNYGYSNADATHHAFRLSPVVFASDQESVLSTGMPFNLYMRRSKVSDELREYIAKHDLECTGLFLIVAFSKKKNDSIDVHAELLRYKIVDRNGVVLESDVP